MFYDIYETLCKRKNVSLSKAAQEIGFNKSSITNWKNNGYTPRQEILLKIADYFNVSVDYLLGKTDEKNKAPSENGTLNDKDIKVALFGGDAEIISDEAWSDVKSFAQKVAELEKMKKGYNEE